jgi:hypothetical protein
MSATHEYLQKYAETEVRAVQGSPGRAWDEVVLVPCYGENTLVSGCLDALGAAAQAANKSLLVLLLINGELDSPDYGAANRALLDHLGTLGTPGVVPGLDRTLWIARSDADVLVVDRTFSTVDGSPHQTSGVGWARKLGCDLALQLREQGWIRSPWIHTTDADARVEAGYFDLKPEQVLGIGKRVGVYLHPFRHEGAENIDSPMGLYDRWLRYFENGLRFAGSPFAFPTIGSLISIDAGTYAAVRGFPKREAAEDFYLLAKAAKIAQVAIGGGGVVLTERESKRVPFGTGVGVSKISARLERGETFTLYAPQSFVYLKRALDLAGGFLKEPSAGASALESEFAAPVLTCLVDTGYFAALKEAAGRKSDDDKLRTFHSHWDAFRTLKFIHLIRDRVHPEIPWQQAVSQMGH